MSTLSLFASKNYKIDLNNFIYIFLHFSKKEIIIDLNPNIRFPG